MKTPRLQHGRSAGFTLIELLVVIAVIGLLASVILAAVSGAKAKAQTVVIAAEVKQLQTLLEQNQNDFKSYANVEPVQWFGTLTDCANASVSGTYAAQFKGICKTIISNESGTPNDGVGTYFYVGNPPPVNYNKYSILVWIPSKGSYYCAGSNQATSYDSGTWFNPGCYNDATL